MNSVLLEKMDRCKDLLPPPGNEVVGTLVRYIWRQWNALLAAQELEDFLGKNSGVTDDWPLDIVCRDKQAADKCSELLNNLRTALKALEE